MRSPLSSSKWISGSFLVLLGYFAIVSSIDVQGSIECDRQAFSSVDCPPSSSGEDETNNNDDDDDSGNIEEQIPSVLPFP
jgi:hypothetical protein